MERKPKAVAESAPVYNAHFEVAERIMQLARRLADDPEQAKAFAQNTGVYTSRGELAAAYR